MEPLTVLLASPRSFCAGVERAIHAVKQVRARFARAVFVRHQIVHNRQVIESLEQVGVTFVEDLSEVPDGAVTVLSAHRIARRIYEEAPAPAAGGRRHMPLVRRVHMEVRRHARANRTVIIIGHAGHEEVNGIQGQVDSAILVVGGVAEVAMLTVPDPSRVPYVTQTTLSVSDTREIIAALEARFPDIINGRGLGA